MALDNLSRKQRAAVAAFGMLVVTAISLMLNYYGIPLAALIVEIGSVIVYTIWVRRGK